MTHRPTPRIARLLGALLAIAVAIAGPPAVLLLLVGNPLDIPSPLRNASVLSNPLDDHTLLWLLSTAAWLLWLHLQVSLLVELLRQTRGSTVRVPWSGLLFGANNLIASQLIATVLLTLHPPAATGHLLTPAAAPAAVTATLTSSTAAAATRAVPLAPALATEPQKAVATVTPGAATVQCRVLPPHHRHHDTLWDIAERHLGDGTRWREIFDLNDGRLMPDGHRLTKASLIYPGWILHLPADAQLLDIDRVDEPSAPASAPPGQAVATPAQQALSHPADSARSAPGDGNPESTLPLEPRPRATSTEEQPAPARSSTASPAATSAPPQIVHDSTDSTDSTGSSHDTDAAVAGGLAVASLGLLAALTRRRKVAARRRPPGTRPATPAPELTATEAQLRTDARAAADVAATVRLALLLAARHATHTTVKALWHHPDGSVDLVLTHPPHDDPTATAEAPPPFEATAEGWRLPPGARRYLFATSRSTPQSDRLSDALQNSVDPFPLLLPVGIQDGSACYVNLETYGLISLLPATTGADEAGLPSSVPAQIVSAWVHALAGAPWSELMQLAVAPSLADLAVGMERIDVLHPQLLSRLEEFVNGAVPDTVHDAGSLDAARRTDPDGAGIIGTVVLAGLTPDQVPARLLQAATRPTEPLAMLLLGAHPDAHPWQLQPDGTLTIPGVAQALHPLRLDPQWHELLLRLLEHAQDPPHAAADDPGVLTRAADNPPTPAPPLAQEPSAPPPPPTADTPPDESEPRPPDQPGPELPVAPPSEPLAENETAEQQGEAPQEPDTSPIQISLLGPLTVDGTDSTRPRGHVRQLLVYLAVHRRPVPSQQLWEAVFPDRPYNAHVLRSRMSDLRKHIRRQLVNEGHAWALAPTVSSDWQRFRALAAGSREDQLTALALVRGLPFDGVDADWLHLEGHHAEIEAAIVDLALLVGQEGLDSGDPTTAATAATAGLRASPYDERLYRLAMTAAAARGATGQVRALRRQLERVLDDELEPDDTMQPSTEQLYRDLLDAERPRRR